MLNQKTYFCGICNTKPDQISHHKSHLYTQKHKDKKELFELKLEKLTDEELQEKYKIIDIVQIITNIETIENKKLIQELTQPDIDTLRNTIMTETMSITNKDALTDKMHGIHNYSRNNGVGYGMNALKTFNVFFGLKKIEENGLFEKTGLIEECRFSYLLKLANENKYEQLAEIIFGVVLSSISESNIRDLIFYEIPKNIKSSVFAHLVKEIDSITLIEKSCNVLLSGKIYEYFIGRCQDDISDLGAYFTDRHIVDFIYNKLQPTVNDDGEIGSMIDMFGGSGGFTTGYINYLQKHFNIDWEKEIEKVYHYDMNEDVIKSAGLEFFCLTGVLPNMKHLQYKNSFKDEFVGEDGRTEQKYKYVITNPPYGGDKNIKPEAQIKREKIKEYIKKEILNITGEEQLKRRHQQLKQIEIQEKYDKKEQEKTKVSLSSSSQRIQRFAKKYNLKGNDKEACSLILMMELLEENGTCIGVLKEGIFFNKTYNELRKILIENYNVREVISVPQDQFENTSTKTSIIIFDNTAEKTKEIKFSNLIVERYEEDKFEEILGDIYLVESKGDIKDVADTLISQATRAELLTNKICSLNGKDYNKKEIICGENYKLVKLGDISKINSSLKIDKNNYNYVEISDINDNVITNFTKLNKNELPTNAKNIAEYGNILLSCVRPKKSKMTLITKDFINIENYIFTTALANIKLKDPKLSYYVYSILYNLVDNFEKELCSGSSYPRFKPSVLQNLQIPIPKSEEKIKEWVDKISKPYDKKNKKEEQLKQLEIEIENKIKNIIENEECDEVELGDIIKREKNGKTNSTEITNTGEYDFYAATSNNPIGTHDNYNFDGDNYLLFAKSGGNSKTIFGESLGIGKFWLVSGKTAGNIAIIKFTINKLYNINYINKYLKYILYDIQKFALYTTGNGNINIDDMLKNFKIKIPKNKELINNLEPLFNKIEKLQTEIKENKNLYNQFIQELADEALPKI